MAKASKKIILKNVRASYANVFTPRAKLSGEGEEYSIQVILKNDHPQLATLKSAIKEVAEIAFPGKSLGGLKLGLRDAAKEGKDSGALENAMFFNARSQSKPQVIRGSRVVDSAEDFYSGCYMNISISVYDYDVSGSRGITFGLGNIQFARDGERLDGRTNAFEEFDIIEEDDADVVTLEPASDGSPTPAPAATGTDDDIW